MSSDGRRRDAESRRRGDAAKRKPKAVLFFAASPRLPLSASPLRRIREGIPRLARHFRRQSVGRGVRERAQQIAQLRQSVLRLLDRLLVILLVLLYLLRLAPFGKWLAVAGGEPAPNTSQ